MKIYNTTKQHIEKGLSDRDRKEIKLYGIILKDAQREQIRKDSDFKNSKPKGDKILKDIWDQKTVKKKVFDKQIRDRRFVVIKLIEFIAEGKKPILDEIFKPKEYDFSFDLILYLINGGYIKQQDEGSIILPENNEEDI